MKTVMVKGEVLANGHLCLDVPCDMPLGRVEVCLVIQPEIESPSQKSPKYSTFEGCMAGRFPENLDITPILDEMSRHWQKSLLPE